MGEWQIELHDRAGRIDTAHLRDRRIERFIETIRGHGHDREIRVSTHRSNGALELIERRSIDEMHGKSKCDAGCDRYHRKQHTQRIDSPLTACQPTEECRLHRSTRPSAVSKRTRSAVAAAALECVTRITLAPLCSCCRFSSLRMRFAVSG